MIAGGHSYGGRQTSMVVAEQPRLVEVLTLFSYPLHPPGKPDRSRTEHLPRHHRARRCSPTARPTRSARIEELRAAARADPGPTEIVEITGARHDLGSKTLDVPALAVDAARDCAMTRPAERAERLTLYRE